MPLPKRISTPLSEVEEIYCALVLGVKDYVKKNGFEKVLIGLSGGIDSSLTAVITRDALGSRNVVGVSMPSRYTSQETMRDVQTLSRNLDIRLITIPIDTVFDVYLRFLEKPFAGARRDVTEENLQARIRGNILMALSNKFKWLVLTTGNKSETAVGYCTPLRRHCGGLRCY